MRTDQTLASDRGRRQLLEVAAVVVLLVVMVASRADTLRQPLREAFGFRQSQTAFQTRIMHEEGISWLHPKVPVLGAPWEIPFELPLFQASASVIMAQDVGAEAADRVAGLAWFTVTAALVFALVRRFGDATPAFLALVVFCFSPFAFVWSRASMIEFAATATTLGWVLTTLLWRERPRWWLVPIGAVLGAAALTTKATTGAVWLLPILFFKPESDHPGPRRSAGFAALIGVPFAAGLAWTRHANGIKAANPATAWLTESNLRTWNYGTVEQRLDPENLGLIFGNVEDLLTGRVGWLAVLGVVLLVARHRRFWIAVAATIPLSIGTFYNLYVVHDYYLSAVTPAVAMTVGLGLSEVIRRIVSWLPRPRPWLHPAAVAAVVVIWVPVTLGLSDGYWRKGREEVAPPPQSAEIASVTERGDRVIVAGNDWSPEILYYADRRGMMIKEPHITREIVSTMSDLDDYRLFFAVNPDSDEVEMATVRGWWGPLRGGAIRIGDELGDIDPSLPAATDDARAVDGALRAGRPVALPTTAVTCDGLHHAVLPGGTGDLWVAWRGEGTVRVWFDPGRPPIPPGRGVVLRSGPAGSRPDVPIWCSGGGTLELGEAAASG